MDDKRWVLKWRTPTMRMPAYWRFGSKEEAEEYAADLRSRDPETETELHLLPDEPRGSWHRKGEQGYSKRVNQLPWGAITAGAAILLVVLAGLLISPPADRSPSTPSPTVDQQATAAYVNTEACPAGSIYQHARTWEHMAGSILNVECETSPLLPDLKTRAWIVGDLSRTTSQFYRFRYVERFIIIAQDVFSDPACSHVEELRLDAYAPFTTDCGGTESRLVLSAIFPRSEAEKVVDWTRFRNQMSHDTRAFFSRIVRGVFVHPQVP